MNIDETNLSYTFLPDHYTFNSKLEELFPGVLAAIASQIHHSNATENCYGNGEITNHDPYLCRTCMNSSEVRNNNVCYICRRLLVLPQRIRCC